METWREMWIRCSEERDHKLRSLTQSLSKKFVSNSEPKRTTKLAFVDTTIKVPKNVARAQVTDTIELVVKEAPLAWQTVQSRWKMLSSYQYQFLVFSHPVGDNKGRSQCLEKQWSSIGW